MKKLIVFILTSVAILVGGASCSRIIDISERLNEVEVILEQLRNQVAGGVVITSIDKTDGITTLTLSNGQTYQISDGKDGKDGVDGKDGIDGKDGETLVADIKIEDSFVVLTFKNGETLRITYQNSLSLVSLNIIPDYTDGSVRNVTTVGNSNYFSLSVAVTPEKYTETLADTDKYSSKASFVVVHTKGSLGVGSFDITPTEIKSKEGYLDVTFEIDSSIASRLVKNNFAVSFSITDTDGVHGAASGFVPVSSNADDTNFEATSGDALPAAFSVSPTKKVQFSKGNLTYNVSKKLWAFYAHQYDRATDYDPNLISLFTWGFNKNNSIIPDSRSENNVSRTSGNLSQSEDWGSQIGDGKTWRTLTIDEWKYLFEHHTYRYATVCNRGGIVIAPEGYTEELQRTYPDDEIWGAAEKKGLVFFAPANYRIGDFFGYRYNQGWYWSATAADAGSAHVMYYDTGGVDTNWPDPRYHGLAVRLVKDCK